MTGTIEEPRELSSFLAHRSSDSASAAGAADAAGAALAELAGQVDRLVREIEAFKSERATTRMRIARAILGVAYHARRAEPAIVSAEAA